MLALRTEDPDAVRAGDPDVPLLVALHAVDEAALLQFAGPDLLGKDATVGDRAVGFDGEDADMRAWRVVDVQQRLVRRKAQPIRLLEVVDEELRISAFRCDSVDTLEVEVLFALDPEARHPPVGRIAEVDRTVRLDDDIV